MDKKTVATCKNSGERYIGFNINCYVRVRLTDFGRTIHRLRHEEFWASTNHPNPPKYVPPVEDEEGWSVWQLWSLMGAFGDQMKMHLPNCFDLNIELEVSDELNRSQQD